ncbi:hypothetical protein VHEMI07259 [[Torrubiella] hemipterigena]|uniref:Major facilitator superfamily (MFS) profile domain-containing protein n=1 Tax=[Torrubiella] hemipterigena TaxID=1531966 RepID=A0A0A1TMK7_9HYPO|nr:hypothetical protein VHEMI07259 [[Torrubiella] hemipterigena]
MQTTVPDAEQPGELSDGSDHYETTNEKQGQASTTPPPDGGYKAWSQSLLMHIVFFNTWGVANGYGVFQEYYTAALNQPPSSIAWIGSVQVFLLFGIGMVSGRLTDAGYFRPIFTTGVVLQVFGIFMTSLCTEYWQIFLAQAVCLGIGNGLTFCPALAVLAQYFKKNRAFAVGLAAAGAAVGGLVYPVLINRLIFHQNVTFGWTLRAMGLIMLITYIPCVIWFQPRLPPTRLTAWTDTSAFTDAPFMFFSLSMFLNFWGLYFAFFFLGTFARDKIGVSEPMNLVMVLNGVGILGRVLPTIIADRWTGMLNLVIPISVICSVVVFCWIAVVSATGLYVFAVVYGLLAASLQALLPAVATTMTPDPSKTGTRVGMILGFVSLANLTGPAICGAIIERGNGSYVGAQIFAGAVILLGAAMALAARIAKGGMELRTKI